MIALIMFVMIITPINAQKQLVKKTVITEAMGFKQFSATAYCLQGKTASGIRVRPGIIAADPRVLKLGSTIEIFGLGNFLVADIGGGIKNNKIDIWMPCGKAIKWGRKNVLVKKIK